MIDKKNILLSQTNFFRSNINILPSEIEHEMAQQSWEKIPVKNRGYIAVRGVIHFDDIIAMDEKGDEIFEGFQIYANWKSNQIFFYHIFADLEDEDGKVLVNSIGIDNRIKYFPNKLRKDITN